MNVYLILPEILESAKLSLKIFLDYDHYQNRMDIVLYNASTYIFANAYDEMSVMGGESIHFVGKPPSLSISTSGDFPRIFP